MPYAISEVHAPHGVIPERQKLLDAITALPQGKAITITDDAKRYAVIRGYVSQIVAVVKKSTGGRYTTKKQGPHAIEVARVDAPTSLKAVV